MRRMFSALFCVAICVATASTSFGAAVIYTNEASFTAQLQAGYNLETFTGYGPWLYIGTDANFGTGSYAWHAHAELDNLWAVLDGAITAGRSDDHIQMTFGNSVTAVGGNFTAVDDVFQTVPNTIELTLADGTTYTTSNWDFVGFASPGVPIVSLDVWCPDGALYGGYMPTIDNVYTGSAKQSTLITLTSFNATPGFGKVILAWETASEIDNAGFNLYRAESANGTYKIINSSIIPAKGSSTQGASYEVVDDDVQNRKTYYYKLEDIDLNGTATMHGPKSATPRWIFGLLGK
jgi:hypothetical protein